MPTGGVNLFNVQAGYGFVALDDGGGKDLFFHISAFRHGDLTTLRTGQKVQFNENRGSTATAVDLRFIEI
jgi:cold shock protein